MKLKRKLLSMIMCSLLLMSVSAGYCMAATGSNVSTTASVTYYDFYLNLPKGGVTDLATSRKKVSTAAFAYYDLDKVTNSTNHELYLNVRNNSGSTIVGNAKAIPEYVSGSDLSYIGYVYYKSGYGNTGTYYRPSGQTSNEATKAAYIEGSWRP